MNGANMCAKSSCPTCNSNREYNENFDAYYCDNCNIWLEAKCTDPECRYCPKRPENPIKYTIENNPILRESRIAYIHDDTIH